MRILVLGSQGQLGSSLSDVLKSSEFEITYKSRKEIDISNFQKTKNQIFKLKPKVIINTSAYTKVDDAEENYSDAFMINHLAVSNIASICLEIDCWLIHISTDYVFDGESNIPYKESSPVNPQNIYGRSKLDGENAIIESGCNYIIIRTAWVFSEHGNNFAKTMLRLANDNEKLNVICDQIGCPTYAIDLAYAIEKILHKIKLNNCSSDIYNYCGDISCSWYHFALTIFEEAKEYGFRTPKTIYSVESATFKTKAFRPKYSVLNCSKILHDFEIYPSNWRDGIKKMLSELNK